MTISKYIPAPVPTLCPKLIASVKGQTESFLSYLLKTNGNSVYFHESPILSNFRKALGEDITTRESSPYSTRNFLSFTETVPLSTYEDYRPYIDRFFQTPRRLPDVSNLLSPGVPVYMVSSSGTAGGTAKFYPKYRHPPTTAPCTIKAMRSIHPMSDNTAGTYCIIFNLRCSDLLDVVDDKGKVVVKTPLCIGSGAGFRAFHQWKAENDSELMKMKVPNTTSPLAICFIHEYRTATLMHGLFALEDRSLEMINTLFSTYFVDLMRLIEEYWDVLLGAIEHGIIPRLKGSEDVYHHLQEQWRPNATRAAELRAVGRDTRVPGWAKRLWPNLQRILGNGSGVFSRVVPQVHHYAGPHVSFQSAGLTCSEVWMGQVYDPRDLNLYKMSNDDLFEYLDITLPENSANLKRGWEVETGKSYELILTTRDGFWRYRLSDVVEIAGFDPSDGQPVIRYSERRNVSMRVAHEFVTEKELLKATQFLKDTLGDVLEFTVITDDRLLPKAYGFLVELKSKLGPRAKSASSCLFEYLKSTNEGFAYYASRNLIAPPTIRILTPGTFHCYREWKAGNHSVGGGQIKVPTITTDEKSVRWLLSKVIKEV